MVFEATTSAEVNNLDTSIIISPPPPLMGKTTTNKSAHQKRSPLNAAAAAPRTNNNTTPDSKAEESRKKRCSDRYDSSESSDSGVAVLSCTESSTASSDSSDPGSPYSPGSVEEALLVSQNTAKNRPSDQHIIQSSTVSSSCKADVPMLVRGGGSGGSVQTATTNPKTLIHPWTSWAGGVEILPKLVPTTSGPIVANNVQKAAWGPQTKCTTLQIARKGKNGPSPAVAPAATFPVSSSIPAAVMGGSGPLANNAAKPQTKITGFFKTQMKSSPSMAGSGSLALMSAISGIGVPPLIKKDLTNLVIRSKEFPKQQDKKKNTVGRKGTAERKSRGTGATKNASLPAQGNTIKDIIMKKPVNIAPRVDSLPQPQPQKTSVQLEQTTHSQNAATTATLSRIAQQPQLVLTAFRVTPDMMRMQGQGTSVPTSTATGTNNAAMNVTGGSTGENKGGAVQFQYPLNGSFVSFANLMGQPHQLTGNSVGHGLDGKPMPNHQQQQIFLSQIGALGKPNNTQFILNGTLVKLANQGTTIEACNGSNGLVNGAANGEGGDIKSSSTLISTTGIPTVLATSSPTKQPTGHNQHQAAPMFMSMGQNGQFILNTTGMPSLMTTQGCPPISGITQTMPSLQPISLSSYAEPHVAQQQPQQLAKTHQVMKTLSNVQNKRRAMPPLAAASSSPPELVLLQPIAKALAAAAVKKTGEGPGKTSGQNKGHKVTLAGKTIALAGPVVAQSPDLNMEKSENVAQKTMTVDLNKEQMIMSKVLSMTEVVRQTTMTTTTTTTLLQTSTTFATETVAERGPEPTRASLSTGTAVRESTQVINETPRQIPITVVPPSLTSPKSLVLEKLKLKSETTIRTSLGRVDDLRLEISTDCLDVAKRQLGVLVDQNQECAKSPILSQPKTIRFPVRNGAELNRKGQRKSGGYVSGICYWEECNARFENSSKLLDHMQTHHVTGQDGPFKCLWQGCRVNGRESCSRRWLEGHVSSHGGSRTFKCIFEGCGQRFSSQLALQKHVNVHLSSSEKEGQCSNRKSVEGGSAGKYLKRNGKKLRYRRQPWSARMFDFFDAGIMEGLQHRLGVSSHISADGRLQLKGRELGRRIVKGVTEVYVEWSPANIIPDDWVCITPGMISEHIVCLSPLVKSIPVLQLSHAEQCSLQKHLRKSYTMPLEVDTSIVAAAFNAAIPKTEADGERESGAVSMALEQDSDSGKGTQRSESSAASPVTCSSKSEIRKLKRKSKSLSSESSEPLTEDSGLQTNKTAKKLHLKLGKDSRSSDSNKSKEDQPQAKKKQLAMGVLSSPRKKSQYLGKAKKTDDRNVNNHCPKSIRVIGGERKMSARKDSC